MFKQKASSYHCQKYNMYRDSLVRKRGSSGIDVFAILNMQNMFQLLDGRN